MLPIFIIKLSLLWRYQFVITKLSLFCSYQFVITKLSLLWAYKMFITKLSFPNCHLTKLSLPNCHYQIVITKLSSPNWHYQKSARRYFSIILCFSKIVNFWIIKKLTYISFTILLDSNNFNLYKSNYTIYTIIYLVSFT